MRRLVKENNMAGGRDPTSKVVIHHCSALSMYQANACVLMGAYAIFDMGLTAEEAFGLFKKKKSRLAPFTDSGKLPSGFGIQVNDCLKALEKARQSNWYNPSTFDWKEYDKMSLIDEGDLNWIIPGQLIAMTTPSVHAAEGLPPACYTDYFKKHDVSALVRLNEKLYHDEDFYREKIRVYPMELRDGAVPSEGFIVDFIMLCENEIELRQGVVAVHCRAGLGRTGTVIACYLMHKFGMEAKSAMAWVRMCRPGSIIGKQ